MEYGQPIFGTVSCSAPEAVTTVGRVRGEMRDGVAIFRGIPYGDDTASRRFLPPVPAKAWEGVRDCTKNGDIAWQYGGSISGYVPLFNGGEPEKFGIDDEKMSEDCLRLNVLTPGMDDKSAPFWSTSTAADITTAQGPSSSARTSTCASRTRCWWASTTG